MEETTKQFESEMKIIQSNIDTLRNRYLSLKGQSGAKNSGKLGYEIGKAENEYFQYEKTAREQMERRRQNLLKGVLDKINIRIQEYGKTKGYRMIFGATTDGSILYGIEQDDKTPEILGILNSEYEQEAGKKQKDLR